jgi:hypothetical protein
MKLSRLRNFMGRLSKPCVGMALGAAVLAGCGKSKATVALNLLSANALQINTMNTFNFNPLNFDPVVGPFSTTTSQLQVGTDSGLISYKVYFRSIQLCESITASGSAYSATSGCSTIYENLSDEYTGTQDPSANDVERFTAAGTGKYYDLLNDADRTALSAGASVNAGSYKYAIIETHPWVKVKAKSGTLCTKSGGTLAGSGQFSSYMQVTSLDCGSGGPEEALVYMTNGNSSFEFGTALEVAEGASVISGLIYNLDDAVVAVSGTASNGSGNLRDNDSGGGSFSVPQFAATAALLPADQAIVRETYLFDITSTSAMGGNKLRIDMYYGSGDSTKTPIGVAGGYIVTTGTTQHGSLKFDKVVVEDSTVKIYDWKNTIPVEFTRTAAGVASTGSGSCGTSGTSPYLGACDASAGSASYTLSDSNGPTLVTFE